ncbi:hypothetical protein D3C72_2194300 [compost metagenome]
MLCWPLRSSSDSCTRCVITSATPSAAASDMVGSSEKAARIVSQARRETPLVPEKRCTMRSSSLSLRSGNCSLGIISTIWRTASGLLTA